MLVVSHESVGVVAFSLWAAFELHLAYYMSTTFAEIVIVGVARSAVATQQPQPGRPCNKQKLAP